MVIRLPADVGNRIPRQLRAATFEARQTPGQPLRLPIANCDIHAGVDVGGT